MKADILSPSAINRYLGCPLRHYYTIEGKPKRPKRSSHVGSCFHNCMDAYVRSRYTTSIEESMNWSLAYIQPFPPDVVKEALDLAKEWLRYCWLPPANRIFASEISFGPPGTSIYGKPVDSEIRFDSGLRLRGIMDLVWIDSDDTLIVGDYKTQKSFLHSSELSTKIQAMAYALVVHKFHPDRAIRVEFYMIRFPEDPPVKWVPETADFEHIENLLWSYQQAIREDNKPVAQMSDFCQWCEFTWCCTSFQEWSETITIEEEERILQVFDAMPLTKKSKVIDEWQDRFISSKGLLADMKEKMKKHMEIEHVDAIGPWEIKRKAKYNYTEDAQRVINSCGGIKHVPKDILARLQQHKVKSYGNPYLWRNYRRRKRKSALPEIPEMK